MRVYQPSVDDIRCVAMMLAGRPNMLSAARYLEQVAAKRETKEMLRGL